MPLFSTKLALDKHDGNMLFGEGDVTFRRMGLYTK